MNTAEQKSRRAGRFVLWWVFGWAVGVPLLFFGYMFARLSGSVPNPESYFGPTVTTTIPDPAPFDQAKWDGGRPADRIAIGKWLVNSNRLLGMKRGEVVAMLGPSEYESQSAGEVQLTWPLGTSDTGGWPLRWTLYVQFKPTGYVKDVQVLGND